MRVPPCLAWFLLLLLLLLFLNNSLETSHNCLFYIFFQELYHLEKSSFVYRMAGLTWTTLPLPEIDSLRNSFERILLANVAFTFRAQQDGSVDKGACDQGWWPEFNPWAPCGGRRELNPIDCLLTSTHARWQAQGQVGTHAHTHTHLQDETAFHRLHLEKRYSIKIPDN